MVTGASTANLALVLIDARKGMIEQTRRHAFIASLLQIPHLVICVNKMDLVDYDETVFNGIVKEFKAFSAKLNVSDIQFIPISALKGDNVVNKSEHMKWFNGGTLLHTLETTHIGSDENHIDCRFPIQTVIRPHNDEYHDFRGYAGRIAGGIFKPGDEVVLLPSGLTSKISAIYDFDKKVTEAFAPMSVTIELEDDVDAGRGDMMCRVNNQARVTQDLDVMLSWMHNNPPRPRAKYILRHTTNEAKAMITNVQYKVDVNSLHRVEDDKTLQMNDIARVQIRSTKPIMADAYNKNRHTGSLILVDEGTNETVAAGMII
jgi:sulfate adenylyltransferase subunit 1